jgi:hypothetical protein
MAPKRPGSKQQQQFNVDQYKLLKKHTLLKKRTSFELKFQSVGLFVIVRTK